MVSWGDRSSAYGRMRASTADRERAIDVLKAGFAEGRLSREELEDRQARVLTAKTYDELGALTADLPAGPLGGLPPAVSRVPAVAPAPAPPAAYPYAPSRPVNRTNRLAIVTLVTALVPVYGTIISLICGHFALSQIRERGERGAWLALAGLAISYATGVLFVIVVVGQAMGS